MTTMAPNTVELARKKQRKVRATVVTGDVLSFPSLNIVAIRGGGVPSSGQVTHSERNVSIERAIRSVKSALKSDLIRAVRPQVDNATVLKAGTREIYSREEIMARMRFFKCDQRYDYGEQAPP